MTTEMDRAGVIAQQRRRRSNASAIVAELHGRSLCRCDPTVESYACPDEQVQEMEAAVIFAMASPGQRDFEARILNESVE